MTKTRWDRFLGGVFAYFGITSGALAITLDDFNISPQQVANCPFITSTNSTSISRSSSIGGSLSLRCTKLEGTELFYVGAGFGTASSNDGSDARGIASWEWDGNVGDPNGAVLDPSGLGGIDLTQDTSKSLILENVRFDCPGGPTSTVSFVVRIFDSRDGRYTEFSRTLDCSKDPLVAGKIRIPELAIPYTSFTNHNSALPVDFKKVGAIQIVATGPDTDKDFSFKTFRTDGNCSLVPALGGRVVDDCGVCNGKNEAKDSCGVCFGNNKDLDDCGVCGGKNARKDSCGICGGDNTSCLTCVRTTTTPKIASIDEACEQLVQNALFFVQRVITSDPAYAKAAKKKITSLRTSLHQKITELPTTNLDCGQTVLCVQSSVNAEAIAELEDTIQKVYETALKLLTKPTAKKGKCRGSVKACKARQNAAAAKVRSLKTLIKKLYNEARSDIKNFPASTTVCPEGIKVP